MEDLKMHDFVKKVVKNMPSDWLRLTTHRLDIYNEKRAKFEFLEQFNQLFDKGDANKESLYNLPTAYDYVRLGHPLSCILEWAIAKLNGASEENVISFSSATMPVLAVLRHNHLLKQKTRVVHDGDFSMHFDPDTIRRVYGYDFDVIIANRTDDLDPFDGSTLHVATGSSLGEFHIKGLVDFYVNYDPEFGSVIVVNKPENTKYVSEIQHVRRRESIAMTPADSLRLLGQIFDLDLPKLNAANPESSKAQVQNAMSNIAGVNSEVIVASSGLSIQYAISMGLIDHALTHHAGKQIKFLVPPNCYGGTNDQARRVADCLPNVEVVDLPVDDGNDMGQSLDPLLDQLAHEDAVPFIIAEIPTNPRVEVPDMQYLIQVLTKERETANGQAAVAPVFILDQTFCPNTPFLGDEDVFKNVQTIAYISGSKFPSGGMCNAGFCIANSAAKPLLSAIDLHMKVCDNEATGLQYEVLAEQLPSMKNRVQKAYENTREFVTFIEQELPDAKINFVSQELAEQGFTPSVFSLDLPTKGETEEERETYKRELNHRLINMMINDIPDQSKYCVSYGQLKGCYWTIPATSTQGTTKEGDKDYIARVAVSPDLDLDKHFEVFMQFVRSIEA